MALPCSKKITSIIKRNFSKNALFIIYADLECIIEKIDVCKINPENSSATKVNEHILSRFSISLVSSFKSLENRHDVYIGKYCIKKLCKSLREHAIKIINFKKKTSY